MKTVLCAAACLLLFCGCRKTTAPEAPFLTPASPFKRYTIPQGQHFCSDNPLQPVGTAELKFTVRFDSSAVYQTLNPENQTDINKLYGFSDNGEGHHRFSARFGWRWSGGALRLFAYTYNNGAREEKELDTASIGKEMSCSIRVDSGSYVFRLDDRVETMRRWSTTEKAKGYQLYPYFGGDETAPHEVRIWIREE